MDEPSQAEQKKHTSHIVDIWQSREKDPKPLAKILINRICSSHLRWVNFMEVSKTAPISRASLQKQASTEKSHSCLMWFMDYGQRIPPRVHETPN